MASFENNHTIELALLNMFPGFTLACAADVMLEQKMGFSGAFVQELKCSWKRTESGEVDPVPIASPPERLFVKVISFPELPPSTPESTRLKTIRNIQTYRNEIAFLEHYAPDIRTKAGVIIPMCYKWTCSDGCSNESFMFISESVSGYGKQLAEFSLEDIALTLEALARVHALFFNSVGHLDDVYSDETGSVDVHSSNERGVWCLGSHLALSKRASSELEKLPAVWDALCASFGWNEFAGLGTRLFDVATYVAGQLSTFAKVNKGKLTLTHNDIKAANVFFVGDDDCNSVCLIDFQWTGLGLAATDIFYLVATSCSDDCIRGLSAEEVILKPYYQRFVGAYVAYDNPVDKNPPEELEMYRYSEFRRHYMMAALDYMRWLVPYRLDNETPTKYAARREKVDINVPTYKRSEVVLRYLFTVTQEYLPEIELEMQIQK